MMPLQLTQEDEGYENGSESFNVPTPLCRAPQSTMSPWWEIYPSTLQTLYDHQELQSSMQSPHLTDTEVATSSTTNWCSPAQMMRALWDPANITANTPAPMMEVVTPGKEMLHLQYTATCVTPSYPHPPWTHSSQVFGMTIQLPPRKTSQQHHWMTMCGLKIPFQIDTCVSIVTSVPILAHTKAPLQDGFTTVNTMEWSSIFIWFNGLQWHLIRSSRHHDDNKWQWHSQSCRCSGCNILHINILFDST